MEEEKPIDVSDFEVWHRFVFGDITVEGSSSIELLYKYLLDLLRKSGGIALRKDKTEEVLPYVN